MTVVKPKKKWVEEFEKSFTPKPRTTDVPLSLIIPTYNCSVSLDLTLSTLLRQNYSPLEVIIIDAGSTDKTHAIIAQYGTLITRIYSVAKYDLPEMINRGAALATGEYLAVIYPSCFYINDRSFDIFAEAVIDNNYPDLITSNCVIRNDLPIVSRIGSGHFRPSALKEGLAPTSFIACWFKRKFFIDIGKVDTRYQLRFPLDLFCRISKRSDAKVVQLDRTLLDYYLSIHLLKHGLKQISDTWKILKTHFGSRAAIKWFFTLRFTLIVKLLWKSLKSFVFEKS